MAERWTLNDAFWTTAFTMVYSISMSSNLWKGNECWSELTMNIAHLISAFQTLNFPKNAYIFNWSLSSGTVELGCSCWIADYTINRIFRYARTSYRPFDVCPFATFFSNKFSIRFPSKFLFSSAKKISSFPKYVPPFTSPLSFPMSTKYISLWLPVWLR